jgi:hypothetical protein
VTPGACPSWKGERRRAWLRTGAVLTLAPGRAHRRLLPGACRLGTCPARGNRRGLPSGVGIALFATILAAQARRIVGGELPELRPVEALGLVIPLFLVVFATAYLSCQTPRLSRSASNSTTPGRCISLLRSSPRSDSATSRRRPTWPGRPCPSARLLGSALMPARPIRQHLESRGDRVPRAGTARSTTLSALLPGQLAGKDDSVAACGSLSPAVGRVQHGEQLGRPEPTSKAAAWLRGAELAELVV